MAPAVPHVCSFIPPHILKVIAASETAHEEARTAARFTLTASDAFRDMRQGGPVNGATDGATNGATMPHGAQSIIPPHIMSDIAAQHPQAQAQGAAQDALEGDLAIRQARQLTAGLDTLTTSGLNRKIYNCNHSENTPGTLIRSEGQKPVGSRDTTGDPDRCYQDFGDTYNFYKEVFQRNSIDDKGLTLVGCVHYQVNYDNALWDGHEMVFGDGDGHIFNRFTNNLDVIGHELTHGVTSHTAGLQYLQESGAINESISDVFGSMVKQYKLQQTAEQADWLIGQGLFAKGVNGIAIRSMKAPGTAYDDPSVGKDPQPDNYANYQQVSDDEDFGGVHINSGIGNKAFYLVAVALKGNSWDRAGKIWYQTLTGGQLSSTALYQDFADLTAKNAGDLYDAVVKDVVVQAWAAVGITVGGGGASNGDPNGGLPTGGSDGDPNGGFPDGDSLEGGNF